MDQRLFCIYKGSQKEYAIGVSCVSTVVGIPMLKKRIEKQGSAPEEVSISNTKWTSTILMGVNEDIHKVIEEDAQIARIHENAENFDPNTEIVYQYLQIFSAICVIFAHGAGEVGYMAGPLGSIWSIVNDGKLDKKMVPPIWIIVIGASGLVVGLATYGYNVTRAMGTKLAKISPSRGFAAELATALILMISSQYGLPTSSSQCITGSIIGIGLMEGVKGVNWKLFATTFGSWIATMIVMGVGVSAIFSQGIYAPHA
jgi:solute carrier family 20 (sodium-dependent phosphate transporter)